MITYMKDKLYSGGGQLVEIACLSTDTKPVENILTGSLALEVDTGDVYAFDSVSSTWHKIGA